MWDLRTLLEVRKVAGSTTYKQSEACPLRSACLFSLFSHVNKDSLSIQFIQSVNKDLFLLIEISSQKLHTAPLID